jgi:hypothetical protein
MTASTDERRKFFGRLFNFANNAITIAGVVLTTLSGLLIIVFLIAQLWGGLDNPYIGLFAYVVLPVIFILGLIEIPIGMWRRRRKLIKEGATEEELTEFPRLDFNDPHMRRVATIVIFMTAVNTVILGAASFFAVEEMETVEFCGETCHTVMQPEFTAYQDSPHSRVACVDCHIGPGASWFVKSKLDGLRQVWRTAVNTYTRPIGSPIHTLRPARETCEQCHWPNKHCGYSPATKLTKRTLPRTPRCCSVPAAAAWTSAVPAGSTGGTSTRTTGSAMSLRTSDARRSRGSSSRRPTDRSAPTPATAKSLRPAISKPRRGSWIASTAITGPPTPSTFLTHPELRDLPYYKKKAIKAIEGEYESHAAGMAAVNAAITDFYGSDYPGFAAENSELVAKGAELAAQAYGKTVFPAMDTTWETHPNHIGHDDFPGCMRCHDDEMATADGEHVIPMDCETCHVFLLEDSSEYPEFAYALERN